MENEQVVRLSHDEKSFFVKNEDGSDKEYQILFTFDHDKGDSFVVYSDGTDEDGTVQVYASRYYKMLHMITEEEGGRKSITVLPYDGETYSMSDDTGCEIKNRILNSYDADDGMCRIDYMKVNDDSNDRDVHISYCFKMMHLLPIEEEGDWDIIESILNQISEAVHEANRKMRRLINLLQEKEDMTDYRIKYAEQKRKLREIYSEWMSREESDYPFDESGYKEKKLLN